MEKKKPIEMNDCEILWDSFFSQIFLTNQYNQRLSQITSPKLRDEMMNLLAEEHQTESELFDELTKRGFTSPCPADEKQVREIKEQYTHFLDTP